MFCFSNIVRYTCDMSQWNWSNIMNIYLVSTVGTDGWCFSIRASVATVLGTHPCVSSCLWVNTSITLYTSNGKINSITLLWRHNVRDGVSNHQPHDCYSTVYSGADQRKYQSSAALASNAENVSLWWHRRDIPSCVVSIVLVDGQARHCARASASITMVNGGRRGLRLVWRNERMISMATKEP